LTTVELLADELQQLRARAAERDDFYERLQRTKADFINYQKRIQRERERWSKTAVEELCLRILPALDDLERATSAAREDHDVNALLQGIEMIQAKLLKALAEDGITPIEAKGQSFDPAFHEAVAHLHNPDLPEHTIVEELRRGYMIGDRVLRASQVVVSTGGPKRTPEPPETAAEDEDTADVPVEAEGNDAGDADQ
jgi:molecular chaperone GrpE